MPGDASPWDPNDWERHVQNVLKLRYAQPVGSYQHIADEIRGDCGIEGFAVDGTAYQCYACQNWTGFWRSARALYPVEGGEPHEVSGLDPDDAPTQWESDSRALFVYKHAELPAKV